jgi:hypothetical protein
MSTHNRGEAGKPAHEALVFSTDADRERFLDLLERSDDIYETEILAHVLMSAHFH